MTGVASIPSLRARLRDAAREGAVLSIIALALALFYNSVTSKGIFGEPKPSPSAPQYGNAPEIIPLETAVSLHRGGTALFVDSRHMYDFRLGHIPGAICVPLNGSDTIIAGLEIAKDRPIVVYCDGVECNSSLEVGAKFSSAGYSKVYVFFAGWSAWIGSGNPTAKEKP